MGSEQTKKRELSGTVTVIVFIKVTHSIVGAVGLQETGREPYEVVRVVYDVFYLVWVV